MHVRSMGNMRKKIIIICASTNIKYFASFSLGLLSKEKYRVQNRDYSLREEILSFKSSSSFGSDTR